jgi:hypothetical protein
LKHGGHVKAEPYVCRQGQKFENALVELSPQVLWPNYKTLTEFLSRAEGESSKVLDGRNKFKVVNKRKKGGRNPGQC